MGLIGKLFASTLIGALFSIFIYLATLGEWKTMHEEGHTAIFQDYGCKAITTTYYDDDSAITKCGDASKVTDYQGMMTATAAHEGTYKNKAYILGIALTAMILIPLSIFNIIKSKVQS